MLEDVVSDIRFTEKGSLVSLRDHGSFFIEGEYLFYTGANITEMQEAALMNYIRNHPELKDLKVTQVKKPFRLLQVRGPASIASKLPKNFLSPHYTEQLRDFGNPGAVVQLDDKLSEVLKEKEAFNRQLIQLKPKQRQLLTQTTDFSRIKQLANVGFNNQTHELELLLSSLKGITPRQNPKHLTYDEWMKQKWLFLDIEVPFFDSDNPEITWANFTYVQDGEVIGKEIHTLSDLGTDSFGGANIVAYSNETDLIRGCRASILENHPFVVSPYNAGYDLLKFRERSKEFEKSGTKTVKENSKKFMARIGMRGRQVVDLYKWANTVLHHLPRKKLESVAKDILGDEQFKKDINYTELRNLEGLARAGNKDAAREIASYLVKDVDVLVQLFNSPEFQSTFKLATELAEDFNVPLTTLIDSPASVNLAQKREYLNHVGIHRDEIFRMSPKFNKERAAAIKMFRDMIYEHLHDAIKPIPGVYQNVTKAYIPHGRHLRHIIGKRFPDAHKLFSKPATDDIQKFFIAKYGNVISDLLTVDYSISKLIEEEASEFKGQQTTLISDSNVATPIERLVKYKNRVAGNYGVPVGILDKALWIMCFRIKRFAQQNNMNVLFQEGDYLYFTGGDEKAFDSPFSPVVKVDTIDEFFLNNSDKGLRVNYERHGFEKTRKVKESEGQELLFDYRRPEYRKGHHATSL